MIKIRPELIWWNCHKIKCLLNDKNEPKTNLMKLSQK